MTDKQKFDVIKNLALKWSNAAEYFDEIIYEDWLELPPLAKTQINQIGKQLLGILDETDKI